MKVEVIASNQMLSTLYLKGIVFKGDILEVTERQDLDGAGEYTFQAPLLGVMSSWGIYKSMTKLHKQEAAKGKE